MIASSVYSWLKDIRSTFDAYEEEGAHNQSSSLLIRRTSCNHCKGNLMPLESKLFDDDGLQSNTIFTRGTPPRRSYQRCTSKQQFLRAKKAWSVGDSWGVNFQLTGDVLVEESTPTTEGADSSVAMVSGDVHMKDKRCDSGSDSCKDNEELVLQEFAFLNDVEQELEAFKGPKGDFSTFRNNAEEPIYMNISQIKNDKLKHQVNCSDTLSSTYSFVSLAPSELSTSDFSSITASSTSGTYTIDNFNTNTSTSSFSLSQGSVSSSNWKSEEWSDILKQTDYKCPDYETACRMDTKDKVIMRKSPLKKGKSLDLFNLTSVKPHQDQNNLEDDNDGVQLRRKTNRQSVIPVINPQESNRKAIIIPKESNYMHIWECRSKVGKRPVPTPRKNVMAAKLKIQHGRENVVSFAFDETVEFLAPEPPAPSPPIEDHTKDLPSMDVIMWLYELAKQCEYEPDLEIPNSFETTSIPDGGASSSRPFLDPLEAHPAGRSISHPNKSSHTDNIFNFNALKKYKIDNQVVKLSKNDVIEIEDGKLLHKNNGEVKKVLAKTMNSCRVEQKSPKEQVLNFPDDVKIHLFRDSTAKMDNNNVKNRLMQFFKKRPVVETLRTKGIYHNETVFGNTLSQLEQKNGTSIPALVRTCIELVELPKNIITEGLYRSSASMATLQDIRFAINENESAYLDILEKYTTTPDVPSGLLKLFIRELKESLVPEESFDILYNIYRNTSSPTAKYNDVVKCIEAMASAHRDTLDIILRHLIKISEYERQNGMSIDSIAICWGQTMCPLNLNNLTDLLAAKRKNEVVLLLLQAYQHKMADDTCSDLHSKKMDEDMCHIKRVVEKKISGTSRSLQNLHSPTDGANAANVMHVSLQKTSL